MNKIKIGQIGIGHEHAMGKLHALLGMPDVYEIVGLVDDCNLTESRRSQKQPLPAEYEGIKVMTEEELFAIPDLQAVTVETPNNYLVPTAIRCMERGLHMHMDKPGGEEMAPFKKLLDGCKDKGLAIQLGYMLRTNPAIIFCQRAVHQGWLGDIFEIQAGMSHNYGDDAYQHYLGKYPGGIMYILGCHILDVVISLLGRPEKVTPFLKSTSNVEAGINNNCLTIIEYPHGTATLRACSYEVEGLQHRRLTVCGTKGTIELQPLERQDGSEINFRLTLLEANEEYSAGTHLVKLDGIADRYKGQFFELAQIINGEIENPYSYEHELLVQEAHLAASGYTTWETN